MPKNTHDMPNLEDKLSDFTDQVLADQKPVSSDQLRDLEETVILLKEMGQSDQPDASVSERIRDRLFIEWRQAGSRIETKGESWQSKRRNQQMRIIQIAALAVVLILVAIFLTPQLDAVLPGAAVGSNIVIPALLLTGIIIVATIFWIIKRKGGKDE